MTTFPGWICETCGDVFGHEPEICRSCGSHSIETYPLSGCGTVYASTVIRVPGNTVDRDEPFEVCLVDVDENVRVTGRIDGTPGLSPDDTVQYIGKSNGAYLFEAD